MKQQIKDIAKIILGVENTDLILRKKLGIPLKETRRLKKNDPAQQDSILFQKKIEITDPFWYLHSLTEIFLQETYKFQSGVKDPLIIDCGANIGLSIIFFKKLYPESRIIAFEPDYGIVKKMENNLAIFGYEDICTLNKAVWIEETTMRFATAGSLGGSLDIIPSRSFDRNVIKKVPSVRLRDFLSEMPEFLKIDIEGAEFEVLKDCADKLRNVKNIFVE